jgi:hypothetical protein
MEDTMNLQFHFQFQFHMISAPYGTGEADAQNVDK